MALAFGPMGIAPRDFWRMPLAVWRTMLDGYAEKLKAERRQQAWSVSHLLVAAGCDAAAVTPARLLGEKERKPRKAAPRMTPAEMIAEIQRLAEDRRRRVEELGEDAVSAEENAAIEAQRKKARRKAEKNGEV